MNNKSSMNRLTLTALLLACAVSTASAEQNSYYKDPPLFHFYPNPKGAQYPRPYTGRALLTRCPPESDPMLAKRTVENRRLPVAGASFHHAWIGMAMDDSTECQEAWSRFVREWTNQKGDPGDNGNDR